MKRFQQTGKALGSQVIFTLVVSDKTDVTDIFKNLWIQVEAFEQRFSRFRVDSELSYINARPDQKVSISSQMIALLQTCQTMTKLSSGLFNPFILPALHAAGYIGSWPDPESADAQLNYQDRNKSISDAQYDLGPDWVRIPPNTALDFGGIGKGYLLDALQTYLSNNAVYNFWLSLGGDIICSGYDLETQPWAVSIQDATKSQSVIDKIINSAGVTLGIATSGVTKRKGTREGKDWHHIIDPRNGLPAITNVLTATTSAASATQADIFAKCALIVGVPAAKQFVNSHLIASLHLQLLNDEVKIYNTHKGNE